jgi:hypothetical protein
MSETGGPDVAAPVQNPPRPSGRGQTVAITATFVLLGLGFVLLGLPGALVLEGAKLPLIPIWGDRVTDWPKGDAAWPVCILLAFVWPLGIVPAYRIAIRAHRRVGLPTLVIVLALLAVWAEVLVTGLFLLSVALS